jgi:hypothetical protein
MTQLLEIFGYLSVLLRGLMLAFEALTVGGVLFILLIPVGGRAAAIKESANSKVHHQGAFRP